MLQILGAIFGTVIFYGLICWILQVNKNKRFIIAGVITWLLCATVYGFLGGESINFFPLMFLDGLFKYFIGSAIWTIIAVILDKKGKSTKWVLKYIPICILCITIILMFLLILIDKSKQMSKRIMVQDEVAQIVVGTRTLLEGYDDYSKIDNNTIFAALGMSSKNPYGGNYRVDAYVDNPKLFIVSINNVNQSDCKYFVNKKWTESILYRVDSNQYNGAIATPKNCSSNENMVQILYD